MTCGSKSSDSIPAWLSNGEFVLRAAAVRRYGLGFLQAMNGLRLPRERIKHGVRAFADGGLVNVSNGFGTIPTPVLEGSDPRLPGKTFDLVIGNDRFAGLFAPPSVASELETYLSRKAARSTGNTPSWRSGARST